MDTSNAWNVVECWNFGPCVTRYYRFIGDTLLEGQTYQKLLYSYYPGMAEPELAALLREDGDNVIYAYQDTSEFIAYDMDLAEGDTVMFGTPQCPLSYQLVADEVDPIVLLNGEARRHWQLVEPLSGFVFDDWIEGVGSVNGPFSTEIVMCWFDVFVTLNCFAQNDTLKYDYPFLDGCDYSTVGVQEEALSSGGNVSPNPFTGELRVRSDNACPSGNVEVRDVWGRQVLSTIGDLSSGVVIDGSSLATGVYTVHCFCGSQVRSPFRVIKQ